MKNLYSAIVASCLCISSAWAAMPQSHEQIREVALSYAQAQTRTLPGKVSIQVEDIDNRIALAACPAMEAFLPPGAQLMGKTSIGVRCTQQPGWSIFVQATLRISTTVLVAKRPLTQNTLLSAEDFALQDGELTQPGLLTDPAQAAGKILKFGIGTGQILRQDMLRAPYVVTPGQAVDVLAGNKAFSVRWAGQALNNGAEGQTIQVRVSSGQVISGKVLADGSVEVRL